MSGVPDWLAQEITRMHGQEIPGGCDYCDAYQTVDQPYPDIPGVFEVSVHHHDWCPFLGRLDAKREAGPTR
jgi:hypothetical protein